MELKGNAVYFSKEPINVRNAVSVPELNYERMSGEPFPLNCSVNVKASRKILRWMTLGDRRHSRFMKQIVTLKRNGGNGRLLRGASGYASRLLFVS